MKPTKICPFCAEEIQEAAIKCRYCQSDLPPIQPPVTTEKKTESTQEKELPTITNPPEFHKNIENPAVPPLVVNETINPLPPLLLKTESSSTLPPLPATKNISIPPQMPLRRLDEQSVRNSPNSVGSYANNRYNLSQQSSYATKYPIEFLATPPYNQNVLPVQPKVGQLPLVVYNARGYRNGIQNSVDLDWVTRIVSNLKDSRLFLNASYEPNTFGLEDKKYHKLSITVNEFQEDNLHTKGRWVKIVLMCIATIIFWPLIFVSLFAKIKFTFTQEVIFEFISSTGISSTFLAKTTGRVKYTIFSNVREAVYSLAGNISTSNANSIINQMIMQRDVLGI